MNNLPTLYARTQTGAIQTWTVTIHENKYQTTFGQIDGKLQTTNWTECYGTNTGRSNERTPWEQAKFEAEALWKKKKDSGYYETIKDIDVVKFVEPMLAKNFEDYSDKISFPVYSQPKLDGCLHEGSLISTDKGLISIKNITCGTKVLTYNVLKNINEYKQVTGVYKNGVDVKEANNHQWYEITLENGKTLILTGNHRVWVKNLRCWRRADELDGTEHLMEVPSNLG